MAYPVAPTQAYSFTDHSVALPSTPHKGDKIDLEFGNLRTFAGEARSFLEVALSSTGALKAGSVGATHLAPDVIDQIAADVQEQIRQPNAELGQAWAEYLHGNKPIPPSKFANTAITGDHWSSRFWANECARVFRALGGNDATLESSPGYAADAQTAEANAATSAANAATSASAIAEWVYATVAALQGATVPASTNRVRTRDYAALGDGGGGLYQRVAAEPAHLAKAQSADGTWWELVPERGRVDIRQFGAMPGDGTDIAARFQSALDTFKRVFLPAGQFLCNRVSLPSNCEVFGEGAATRLRAYPHDTTSVHMLSVNFDTDTSTADPANNTTGIHIHDLLLDGNGSFLGYHQFRHIVWMSGVTNVRIERVTFYDPRGDCLYLGSGNAPGLERHNLNVAVRDCIFDGVRKNNRNGISVIDCDGMVVDRCVIKRIGNPTLSQSVGGIDFESDNAANNNRYRNVTISNNRFEDIDTTNTAGLSMFTGTQSLLENQQGFTVFGNTFLRCYHGIQTPTGAKGTSGYNDNHHIFANEFRDSISFDILANGTKGVRIYDNVFAITEPAGATYRGGIQIGTNVGGVCRVAHDILIRSNMFKGLRPLSGVLNVYGANGLTIEDNRFEDINGLVIDWRDYTVAGTGQYFDNVQVEGNRVYNRRKYSTSIVTSFFMRWPANINNGSDRNQWINSRCFERDNRLMDGTPRNPGGHRALFQDELAVAAPTEGSWSRGDRVRNSAPAAGAAGWACDKAGTFGTTAAAVTADATNGSKELTNLSDPNGSLLAGQFITVGAGTTVHRIAAIIGTTVHLETAFGGTTGAGLTLQWAAPTFVVV